MTPRSDRPILGAEQEETPPDKGEVSEVNMSPYHRAHPHCATVSPSRVIRCRVAAFIGAQLRRDQRRAARRPSQLAEVDA